MAMRGRGRAVAIRSCLVVACIVCSAAAANSLALDELIKESGKHLENDYSEAKSSEKDQAEDGVQNEEASSQSREDQTPLGEEEYPADANTTISWSLPVYMHPTWLSKYSMCLKPGKTPSYCRFDSKTSQRIYALLTRSWAPQTNQRLSEGSGRWTHSVVNHVTARLGRIEKRCESALIPRKVPAAFMIRSSGRRKKAIVMTSLSGGPLCMPRSHDWRANLPRFLGGFLDATVIIYGQTSNTCFYCHHPQSKTEGCVDDIKRGVDAVIVVGVGGTFESSQACGDGEPADCQQQYFDMWQLLSHRWIESAKLLIHIPSANAPYPPRELFNVDVLMDDSSFVKPVSRCARVILYHGRGSFPNDMVYVGRLSPLNGQLAFLKMVEPRMLEESILHFYGEDSNSAERRAIEAVAKERGIQIKVHGEVSKMKLYHIFSGSKAAIYVGDEINPQSIYEAAAAWLPIFVSGNVRMAGNILNQTRWIKVTQWFHKGPAAELAEDFHQDFFDFLDMAQEDWQWLIMKWNQENAMEETVYHEMCQRMCLCKNDMPHCQDKPSGQKRVSNRPRKLFVGRKRQVPSDLKTETLLAASLIDQDAPLPSNSSIRRNYHLRILPRRSKQQ